MKISLEGKILLVIMLIDCIITIELVHLGIAKEFHPLFDWALKQGFMIFILVKLGISVPLILALEFLRKGKWRSFVRKGQWTAIIGYPVMIILLNIFYYLIRK